MINTGELPDPSAGWCYFLDVDGTLDAAQIETCLGMAKHRPAPPRSDDETRSNSKAETG